MYFLLLLLCTCQAFISVPKHASIALVCKPEKNKTVDWVISTDDIPIVLNSVVRAAYKQHYNHYVVNNMIHMLEINSMAENTVGNYTCIEDGGFGKRHTPIDVRLLYRHDKSLPIIC